MRFQSEIELHKDMNAFIKLLTLICNLNFGAVTKSKVGRDDKGRRIGHTKQADSLGVKAIPQAKKKSEANWSLDLHRSSYDARVQEVGETGRPPNCFGELVINSAMLRAIIERCFKQLASDGNPIDTEAKKRVLKVIDQVTVRSKASGWMTGIRNAHGEVEVQQVKVVKEKKKASVQSQTMDL